MNKKVVITVISVIIVVGICVCLGIVILNANKKPEDMQTVQDTKSEENIENVNSADEIKTENIVTNSKIGVAIQNAIYIPNIYSNYFFKEIEASGLNDRAKIMFTFAKIVTENDYSSMLRQSEDYVGEYITKNDLQKVASTLFTNTTSLKHQEVFLTGSYDSEKGNYIQLPTGFVEFSYIKDIVYKIEQAGDKVTVHTYRMYIDCNSTNATDENLNATQIIYYDSNLSKKAISVSDESMDDESKQTDYLNEKITSGQINKDKLKQGTYTLVKKGSSYLIEDIK